MTEADEKQGVKQERELALVDGKGALVARRFSAIFKKLAVKSAEQKRSFVVGNEDYETLLDEMVRIESYAYVRSLVNYNKIKTASLALAFDDEVKRAANAFDVDLGDLREKLKTITGQRLRRSLSEVERRMNKTIAEVSAQQLPVEKGRRKLLGRLKEMGVTASSPAYLDTLIRTHSQIAYNGALWVTTQQDPSVWGYKYWTRRDERVRPTHRRKHGVTKKKDDPWWKKNWPPNGWNCRCQPIVVFEKGRETRKAVDSETDEGFDFNAGEDLL